MKFIYKMSIAFFVVSVTMYMAIQTLVFKVAVKKSLVSGLVMGVIATLLFFYFARKYMKRTL